MSDLHVPEFIDVEVCAAESKSIQGEIALNSLERLKNLLGEQAASVTILIETGIDTAGLTYLTGRLSTEVVLICQRCVLPFSKKIDSEFSFYPVKTDNDMAELPEKVDAIITEGEPINLWRLLEDELLVSLPMFAMHADEHCHQFATTQEPEQAIVAKKPSPFADLGNLLNKDQLGEDSNGSSTKS